MLSKNPSFSAIPFLYLCLKSVSKWEKRVGEMSCHELSLLGTHPGSVVPSSPSSCPHLSRYCPADSKVPCAAEALCPVFLSAWVHSVFMVTTVMVRCCVRLPSCLQCHSKTDYADMCRNDASRSDSLNFS